MCFSASASFISSGVLTLIGAANLKAIRYKKQWMVAMIPLIFAVQQFAEGIVWIEADKGLQNTSLLADVAKHFYLFVAFFFWPIWTPLSLLWMESKPWRRFFLGGCLLAGIYVVLVYVSYAANIFSQVEIVHHSIQYQTHIPSYKIPYVIAVILPWFFSSFPLFWVLGFLIGGSSLVAEYFFFYAATSVWCFFASLLSAISYKIIKDHSHEVS